MAADFLVHVPVRLLKNSQLSPRARLLWTTLMAFADAGTGETFVGARRVERLLRCGRDRREKAERELRSAGLLDMRRERSPRGRFGRRVYRLLRPKIATA